MTQSLSNFLHGKEVSWMINHRPQVWSWSKTWPGARALSTAQAPHTHSEAPKLKAPFYSFDSISTFLFHKRYIIIIIMQFKTNSHYGVSYFFRNEIKWKKQKNKWRINANQIYYCLNHTSVWLQCEQWEPLLAWQNHVMFQQSFSPLEVISIQFILQIPSTDCEY